MITRGEIQKRLQEEIAASGKSQAELAKLLNIKPQSVQQYIYGRALPSLDTFANICEILDVNPADILCIKKKQDEKIDKR